jgi:hypothetical protein
MNRKNAVIKFPMAKINSEELGNITQEDIDARTERFSEKDLSGLRAVSDFAEAGDESMAMHILEGLSSGARIFVRSLLSLAKTRKK